MKLPNQNSNSQKGQILIIFLLVLVVGLAIALSIASRSVTDVRQTTTSDESNRAYFAAEAGVEDALKKIEDKTVAIGTQQTLDLTQTNRSKADVTVNNLSVPDGTLFEYPGLVKKDDVAQINLMPDFYNIDTAGTVDADGNGIGRTDTLDIYWGETAGSNAAIEVSIVTCTTPCSKVNPSQDFHIYKMGFDASTNATTNFCDALSGVSNPAGTIATNLTPNPPGIDFHYKVSLTLSTSCVVNDAVPVGEAPVLARVRMLYEDSKLAVGSNRLPNQGYEIESLGLVGSGVARKLLVNRLYPALPAVFDYVLYNGSTTKPLSK